VQLKAGEPPIDNWHRGLVPGVHLN